MADQVAHTEREAFFLRIVLDHDEVPEDGTLQGQKTTATVEELVEYVIANCVREAKREAKEHAMPRRFRRYSIVLTAVALSVSPETRGGEGVSMPPVRSVLGDELTAEVRLSVERGLHFLGSRQSASGSFSSRYPVAVNALVGLAFLAAGHTGQVGPYTAEFNLALNFLLESQKPSGYFSDGQSRMYGHGFATLFLAELYGMAGARNDRVRDALKRAVRLIEKSQTRDGGWDYEPLLGSLSRGNHEGDTSITVCQTMALRAARNLGLHVDARIVRAARSFILNSQSTRNGGFYYRLSPEAKAILGTGYPRSAAGVCVLLSLGDYDSPAVEKGFKYLQRNYRGSSRFPFYADYYGTQAMFQAGGPMWREYFSYVRDKLVRAQGANGSWRGGYEGVAEQSTAMALVALLIPYRYLPITER